MINILFNAIYSILITLINLILSPINALITSAIPDLSKIFTLIYNLFDTLFSYANYALNATLISTEVFNLFVVVTTLKLTLPYQIHAIKLAIKWFKSLKL